MNPHDEIEWVEKARLGQRDAFGLLVQRYWQPLCSWLARICQDRQHGEDLCQEAFLKAWTSLATLNEPTAFRVWLFRIAWRLCVVSRKAGKVAKLPEKIEAKEQPPLDLLVDEELEQTIEKEVRKLPLIYQEAYLLWVREEWSFSEIAAVLEVNENTVRWRVHKAREILWGKLRNSLLIDDSE